MTTTRRRKTCKATSKTGAPCGAFTVTGSDYCFNHDPASAAKRAAARSKGGKARTGRAYSPIPGDDPIVAIRTLADVQEFLEWTMRDLLTMEKSIKRTNSLASLIRIAVDLTTQTELAERITALEQRLDNNEVKR